MDSAATSQVPIRVYSGSQEEEEDWHAATKYTFFTADETTAIASMISYFLHMITTLF